MNKQLIIQLKKIIKWLLVIYILLLAILYFSQRNIQYQPRNITSEQFNNFVKQTNLKKVKINTHDNLNLTSLYYPAKDNKPIILFFNGNAATVEGAYYKLKPFIDQGYGVYINVYRGYEHNPGKPNEKAFFKDALNAYDKLLQKGYKDENIIIYGFSIGSGTAVHLASVKPKIRQLIVESGFSSAQDVARNIFFYLPIEYIFKDKFKSYEYIQKVKAKKLFLHGKKDLKVPFKFGKKLYDLSPQPKLFVEFNKGKHNDLHSYGAKEEIIKFISNYN